MLSRAVLCCAVQVTVGATLQLFGHTFQVPLTVQNLQFQARVRAAAQVSSVLDRQGSNRVS
jgi:hypothetical protein